MVGRRRREDGREVGRERKRESVGGEKESGKKSVPKQDIYRKIGVDSPRQRSISGAINKAAVECKCEHPRVSEERRGKKEGERPGRGEGGREGGARGAERARERRGERERERRRRRERGKLGPGAWSARCASAAS